MSKLPNAETIIWNMALPDWGRYFVMDQMYREALVTASQTGPLPGETICIELRSPSVLNLDRLPDLLHPLPYDPVAVAVRRLTRDCSVSVSSARQSSRRCLSDTLQSLEFRGPLDPSFFDPPPEAPDYGSLYWQNLKVLKIAANRHSPDGHWYFKCLDRQVAGTARDDPSDEPEATISQQLPPGHSTDDQESRDAVEFYKRHHRPRRLRLEEAVWGHDDYEPGLDARHMPDTSRLSALLRAFAKGVSRMPVIQSAHLIIESASYLLEVTSLAPGIPLGIDIDEHAGPGGLSRWRVYLQFGAFKRYESHPDWRPEEDVLELFKAVLKNQFGEEALLCFLPKERYLDEGQDPAFLFLPSSSYLR